MNNEASKGSQVSSAPSALLNPSQAVFGMVWSVWYGNLTNDVLHADTSSLPWVPIEIAQLLYVFGSLVWLAFTVRQLTLTFQQSRQLPQIWGNVFDESLKLLNSWWKPALVLCVGLWGFLTVTYGLFAPKLSFPLILFGGLHLPLWLSIDFYLTTIRSRLRREPC